MAANQTSDTVLITGASGGMGRACALLAAARGYRLVLSDISQEKLQPVVDECIAMDAEVECFPLDIADGDAVAAFLDQLSTSPRLFAVIHTVGLSPQMCDAEKIITVDLVCTVKLLEALRPMIITGGCAVCIASMSGHMVPPNPAVDTLMADPLNEQLVGKLGELPGGLLDNSGFAYAYAKRALLNYVKYHATDWGREGKRLLSLSPGLIDTPMGQLEESGDRESYAKMRALIPLRRDGMAGEIAGAALFLISRDASYITGCDLLVDGGFVAAFQSRNQAAVN